MALEVNRITNANLYMNGASFLGKAEEVMLPDAAHKMVEHKALGMVGTLELFAGLEKMEASIKWNSFYSDVLKLAANPTKAVDLQVRANVEKYTNGGLSEEVPAVCYIKGAFKNVPSGSFKQHDNVEASSKMTVWYVKLEINGVAIYEIDVMSNVYKVDGVDILANYRQNLGI